MEWTVIRHNVNKWEMVIESIVGLETSRKVTKTFTLTDAQMSATLALFIGELEDDAA